MFPRILSRLQKLLGRNSPGLRRPQREIRRTLRLESLEDRSVPAAVWTDAVSAGYLLRETPYFAATGFQYGETVQVSVLSGATVVDTFNVTDGSPDDLDGQVDGNILTPWKVLTNDTAGATFAVSVLGLTSGASATSAEFAVQNFYLSIFDTIVPSPGGNPSGSDCVTQLQSDQGLSPIPYGFITFIPTGTLTFSEINDLNAWYSFPAGSYGGGSPRFEIPVDTDGDGHLNGSAFVYFGTPPSFVDTDPPFVGGGFINTGNVITEDPAVARWDLSQFGVSGYKTYAEALAFFEGQPSSSVLDVEFVVDAGWRGAQVALVDSFTVNDKTYETICITDLAVTKTVSNPTPLQGDQVTFTVTLTNNGPAGGTGIAVADLLPAGVSFVSATPSQGTYDSATGVWTVGDLAPQASATLSLVVTATDLGIQTNTAYVSARNERDPNPANNQASASETPIPPSPPVVVTGRIIVEKVTNPSDDTHQFTYSASFGDFELAGQQFTTRDLPAGTYIIAELFSAGWDLVDVVITDPSGNSRVLPGDVAQVTLDAGEVVTVRFTNFAVVIPPDLIGKVAVLGNQVMGGVGGDLVRQAYAVNDLYHDVLGRVPSTEEVNGWTQQLQAGAPFEQVAAGFWNSAEHLATLVEQVYQRILHRSADESGLATWVAAMQNGLTESGLMVQLLASAEYGATHPDDVSFITGLYADVLGRTLSDAELQDRLLVLSQVGRAALAEGVLSSDEAFAGALAGYYHEYLHRTPADAEVQGWLNSKHAGAVTIDTLPLFIFSSMEYFLNAP